MALDVAILDSDGRPGPTVSIRVRPHASLMVVARQAGLSLLARLEDYYEDVDYEPGELEGLLAELETALGASRLDPELRELLSELLDLASRGRREGKGLAAIAD